MEYVVAGGIFVIGFFCGWIISLVRLAKDPSLVRLSGDDMVVKKPEPGNVLVQVTEQTLQMVRGGRRGQPNEARYMVEE